MALTDKLKAIGDGFRASRGTTDKYTLDQMAVLAAEKVAQQQFLDPNEFPDYVRLEAAQVAARVRGVLQDDSIVSVTVSDTHYPGDSAGYSDEYETNKSTPHLCMAVKALGYLLPIDFIAHLGDIGRGHSSDTPAALKTQTTDFLAWFKEAAGQIPAFAVIGNHDSGIYFHNEQTDGGVHTISGQWLYENMTALAASENTVFSGQASGGYGYRDFADKKLRVFFLNTSESLVAEQSDNAMSESQLTWLSDALTDLNAKADAAEWKWLILCHYPADYGATMPLSELLKDYVEGENKARFLCQFHGHVHNFLTDKLSVYENGSKVSYDGRRLCVPNGQYNRENYYTYLPAYPDINYSEPVSYPKTPDTAEDTSFTVNVINPAEEKVYSFCYGAGYDRVIGIGTTVYYSITTNLTNATVTGGASSVVAGGAWSATIAAEDGYALDTVSVTMGGADITASVYADGAINIESVTGNVVITVSAVKKAKYTNLVRTSIDTDGSIYNGVGYKNGYCLSSSGGESSGMTAFSLTGFIPIDSSAERTIRIAGEGVSFAEYGCRIEYFDNNFALMTAGVHNYNNIIDGQDGTYYYHGRLVEEDTTVITLVVNSVTNGFTGAAYMRVSCRTGAKGENLIVTIDEPIE